jgi:hypothetical protein
MNEFCSLHLRALIYQCPRKKIVAQALREVGERVEIHDDHFAPDARDEIWVLEIGRCDRVIVTK